VRYEENVLKCRVLLTHPQNIKIAFQSLLMRCCKNLMIGGFFIRDLTMYPLRTVEEAKMVQGQFLSSEEGGGHIKNLYLRDKKKCNILLVAEQDRKIDLKTLNTILGTSRLSFGSADRLIENLGVRPGAVTPLAMITGAQTGVKLFIDIELKKCSKIYVHPLVNDRTLGISVKGLADLF
jgi:Ala-tRNA(Pro) deacylase